MKLLLFTLLLVFVVSGCATTTPHHESMSGANVAGGIYHTVKSGETLAGISRLYGVDLRALRRANSIRDSSRISKGQTIFIPGAREEKQEIRYTVVNDSFTWPVKGSVIAPFGAIMDKVKNKGIDIRVGEGKNVVASRAGKVVFCDEKLKGFGKTIILDHGDSFQTVYAYNSDILVKVGDIVTQNEVIAKVGRTGRAKEPSLHFEIRKGGEPQNPVSFLVR